MIALILMDVLLMVYSAWCVLPVFALANTVATDNPRHLIHEIKKMKLVDEEEHEQGVGG